MENYKYCSYFFRNRRLRKPDGKLCVVWSNKHEPFGTFDIVGKEEKELLIKWLYDGEKIEEKWKEKERVIYYGRWWYIDKIVWWETMSGYRWEGIGIWWYINLVNEEVKKVIEEELWEKVKKEVEFLPIVIKWQNFEYFGDKDFDKVRWEDIWWEVEIKKWWDIRWYYILNALNKVYRKDVKAMIKRLKWDKEKIRKELEKIYEGKIFVDYILDMYEPEWDKSISGRIWIKEDYVDKIDKRIKPVIYELKCDDMIEEELGWID